MEKIKKYQGLRGWAILFIMISHFVYGNKMIGPFGVSLFIGLSGFLTCYLSKDEKIFDIKWYIKNIKVLSIILASYIYYSTVF